MCLMKPAYLAGFLSWHQSCDNYEIRVADVKFKPNSTLEVLDRVGVKV